MNTKRSNTRRPRMNVASHAMFGRHAMSSYQLVMPGETLQSISHQMRLQSVPISSPFVGAYADMWTFYVPLRLIWDGFEDWILDGTGSPGTTGAPNPNSLTRSGDVDWLNAAWTRVYDDFFAMDNAAPVSGQYLPGLDAYGFEVESEKDVEIDVDATSGSEHVNLKDIRQAYRASRWSQQKSMFTAGYSSLLAAHGVDVSDMMIMPEFLGGRRKWIYPSRTIDESTGFSVQSYMTDLQLKQDRKRFYFPEHGLVFTCVAVRPKIYDTSLSPFLNDIHRQVMLSDMYGVDPEWRPGLYKALWHGESITTPSINGATWKPVMEYSPADDTERMYPDYGAIVGTTDLVSDNHYAFDAVTSYGIKTWLDKPKYHNVETPST